MGAIRGGSVLTGFFALTVPLMPVQAVLLRFNANAARHFPNWYHRRVCRLLGIRIELEGEVARDLEPDDPSSRSHGFIVWPPNQISLSARAPMLTWRRVPRQLR